MEALNRERLCDACRHYVSGNRCEAFPLGIPKVILRMEHDHRSPFAGDNGIRFEPRLEAGGKAVQP